MDIDASEQADPLRTGCDEVTFLFYTVDSFANAVLRIGALYSYLIFISMTIFVTPSTKYLT